MQRKFHQTLGKTFAFMGDEIYLKAGLPIPSRRHYGNYPQIEDGVGMIRSFQNSFDGLLKKINSRKVNNKEIFPQNIRTHKLAVKPNTKKEISQPDILRSLNGTILTGEMFAPILREQIEKLNSVLNTKLRVLAVPNTYFGGDVAVAGLLTGKDFIEMKDEIEGDFVIIPPNTVQSDEPILLDGMSFEELKSHFKVPLYAEDILKLIDENI